MQSLIQTYLYQPLSPTTQMLQQQELLRNSALIPKRPINTPGYLRIRFSLGMSCDNLRPRLLGMTSTRILSFDSVNIHTIVLGSSSKMKQ